MGLMKQIAILFDIEGKSAEQIAKELGLPVSAVREIVKGKEKRKETMQSEQSPLFTDVSRNLR